MKKILILTTIPAPYRYEVFNLLSKEYDVEVFYERNTDFERNKEWFVKDYIKIIDLHKVDYRNKVRNIKQFDFVFIYEYSTKLARELMINCIISKVPYAINCDGAFITKNLIKDVVKRFFIKHASICFASGENAASYFKNYGASDDKIKYHKFTSLFDKQILKERISDIQKSKMKAELGLSGNICVIAVGRFIKSKAFDVLIDAWKNLPDNYQLLLIGGGCERHNYEKQIHESGLKNVMLYDYMCFEQLTKYYQASDMFVLPTLTDVWGLVINEAMANGLPIITTEMCVAGIELIEDDINGYIVPINNSDAISEAIIKIGEDKKLRDRMSENNLKKISEYTYENIAESHIKALKMWEE